MDTIQKSVEHSVSMLATVVCMSQLLTVADPYGTASISQSHSRYMHMHAADLSLLFNEQLQRVWCLMHAAKVRSLHRKQRLRRLPRLCCLSSNQHAVDSA